MIRVAFADNHSEMRVALRLLLEQSKRVDLVCEATNGREAVACVQDHQPDVMVMDVGMPEMNGFEATQAILASAETRVLLISLHIDPSYARQAKKIGAHGFLAKDDLVSSLLTAVETIHRGERYFEA